MTRDDFVQSRDALVSELVGVLRRDEGIDAVWLAGSLGRGQGDAFSDLDVVVVGGIRSVVSRREVLAGAVAPLAARLDSPQNAPVDGAQLNALYDLHPVPAMVDWTYWPTVTERPTDVITLVGHDESFASRGRNFEEMNGELASGVAPERDDDLERHFRFMMLPVVAKYVARGWPDAVAALLDVIGVVPLESGGPREQMALLGRLLDDLAPGESTAAASCMRRYLAAVSDVIEW